MGYGHLSGGSTSSPSPSGPLTGSGPLTSHGALTGTGPLTSGGRRAPASGKKGGGWFSGVERVASNFGNGMVNDVIKTPAAVTKLGTDFGESWKLFAEGPKGSKKPDPFAADLKGMAETTKLSLTDPHYMAQHPDQVLLNVLGLASGGAGMVERLGLAGQAARAGDLSGAAKALAMKPAPVTRLISHDGFTVRLPAANNPLTRTLQKATDRLRERFPDVPVMGAAAKVGKANARDVRMQQHLAEVPIQDMVAKSKQAGLLARAKKVGKLSDDALARQQAIRVVAEGVNTDTRIARHEKFLSDGKLSRATNPEVRAMRDRTFKTGHEEQIKLNTLAKKYLDETGNRPKLADPKIQTAYEAMLKIAGTREELLAQLNKLDTATAEGRLSKPGQFFTGDENFLGGEMRIKTVPKFKGRKSTQIQYGASHGIGEVQTPGSLTHAYSGKAYAGGKIDTNVVRLMAESGLEAQKYWTLLHVADKLKGVAKDLPTSEHDVPMVTEKLPGRPSLVEALARMEDDGMAPQQLASMSHGYEGVRQAVFPSHAEAQGIPGIKFVDGRLLGGLNNPSPLLGAMAHRSVRSVASTIDAINNASKIAILYLKPAYVAPNLLSNVAMNLVQQGFAAPVNLARSAKLWRTADPETTKLVLASMGEGKLSVLDSQTGLASKVAHSAASFWQKPVDVVPRLAAFIYEARRDGVRGEADLKSLFKDPANSEKLRQISLRANDAMIDFGDLSPIERNIISRVIFFYPWVKGSAKWLGRLPVEHPVAAGASGVLGPLGANAQMSALGPNIPAWAEANIPIGGNGPHGMPQTFDPFTVTPWVQSGNLLQSLGAIASGHPGQAASGIADMLAPGLGFATTAVTKGPREALKGLYANLPMVTQSEQAFGGKGSKTYPYEGTWQQALARYILGTGMVPRETSRAELEKSAYLSKHGHTITVAK